jgi:hypothetical protein
MHWVVLLMLPAMYMKAGAFLLVLPLRPKPSKTSGSLSGHSISKETILLLIALA